MNTTAMGGGGGGGVMQSIRLTGEPTTAATFSSALCVCVCVCVCVCEVMYMCVCACGMYHGVCVDICVGVSV